jgi:hypothetical protein
MAKTKQGGEAYADTTAAVKKTTADGPRAPTTAKPAASHEAQGGGSFGGGYSDPSYVGWRDERGAFEGAHGKPSPRHRAMRGENVGGTHTEPGQEASIGLANPLD